MKNMKPTLEKVIVKIYPISEEHQPYEFTFQTPVPCAHALQVAKKIRQLIMDEMIADGINYVSTVK
jgi:hypothetical protein